MAIKREFKCMAHGYFEAVTEDGEMPRCARGCTVGVERAFLTPTSIRGNGRSKNIDSTLSTLAKEFGLSDISNRGGESVMHNNLRNNPISREARDFAPQWHAIQGDREGKADIGKVMAEHGVAGGAQADPGALQAGAFHMPTPVVDKRHVFGDASMLKGALAEGQKANRP